MRIIDSMVQKGLFSEFLCGFLNHLVIFISYKYERAMVNEQKHDKPMTKTFDF